MARKYLIVYRKKMMDLPYHKFIFVQFVSLTLVHLFFFVLMLICIRIFSLESNIPVQEIHEFSFLNKTVWLILSAIYETFFFQFILYYPFSKNGKLISPSKYIILSSVLFGLGHFTVCDGMLITDILQIICHFFAGTVYAFTYYIAKKKKTNAFISVVFIHFLYDFCAIYLIWLGTPN